MKNKKKILSSFILILLIVGFIWARFNYKLIKINGIFFLAKAVYNQPEKARGLGGKKSFCRYCAMLFEFDEKKQRAFWMKGMLFNLDILWISEGKIVYIKKDFKHDSGEIIKPAEEANKVLEINAGLSEKLGIKIGDELNTY